MKKLGTIQWAVERKKLSKDNIENIIFSQRTKLTYMDEYEKENPNKQQQQTNKRRKMEMDWIQRPNERRWTIRSTDWQITKGVRSDGRLVGDVRLLGATWTRTAMDSESQRTLADGCFLKWKVCLLVGCLTSQQQASVSQGQICSDNFTCCHTEIEVADPKFYLTQSQYTDTGPTSPSADPIMSGAWQGSHWSANF